MSTVPGYTTPCGGDCDSRGCWKDKASPNIELFAGALPRKLAFSDIDGVAEVNGHFLFLEWKSHGGDIPMGQRILFERLTKASPNISVVIVDGDPETMETRQVRYVHKGLFSEWRPCDLEELNDRIRRWSTKVDIQTVRGASMITFIAYWFLVSCIGGIAFCWLLKRGTIKFEPIEDRNEFSRNWERRS